MGSTTRILRLPAILFICLGLCGCGGGGGITQAVGNINGPDAIEEFASAEFSINVESGTGVTYLWSCDPPDAGTFDTLTAAKTNFTAAEVLTDTPVELRVVVTFEQFSPVIKTRNITILDTARLKVGEIDGPDRVDENTYAAFSVAASGDAGIAYEWSCDPPLYGVFDIQAEATTIFTANEVSTDTQVEIRVTVNSHNYGPETGAKDITIINTTGWARTWGGTQGDGVNDAAIDAFGNIFVTGYFYGTVDFDPGPGVDEHTSYPNYSAIYLCKYNPYGDYQWARIWGETGTGTGYGVKCDDAGNVYVAGEFFGTVDFNPGPGTDEHTANGGSDVFLSKLDQNGEFLWARVWGGDQYDRGFALAVDNCGNAYVSGVFYSTVDFDPGPGVDEHTTHGESDAYLIKFDSNGDYRWVRTWGGDDYEYAYAVGADDSGNVFVSGSFNSEIVDFDPGDDYDTHKPKGETDAFLSKLSSDGVFQWARTWGGFEWEIGFGVAVDSLGDPYVIGWFCSTADFDPGPGYEYHSSNGEEDIFLSKLNSEGDFQWARTWGGQDGDRAFGVCVDSADNVCVTGKFRLTVDFDTGPGACVYTSSGSADIFIGAFNTYGEFNWALAFGDTGGDEGYGVAADDSGDVYLAGHFSNVVDFNPGPESDCHTSNGWGDLFLTKIPPDRTW